MRERKVKEPIKVRQRLLKDGNISLYLDIYYEGSRNYEYLKLYLIPERTKEDKERNRQTLQLANSIKAKRIVELQNGEHGFRNSFNAGDVYFFDYYIAMCEERKKINDTRGNYGNWFSCLHHLRIYEKNKRITFARITPEWVQGFKDYLDKEAIAWAHDIRKRKKDAHLSRNSKMSYFNKLRACINRAFEQHIIMDNPLRGIESFKEEEGKRMYLTIDELKKLANTECQYDFIKKAFLFSCLTGLRRSDIENLRWNDVQTQGLFTRIIFKQKKTGGQEYLDIAPQAVELMGERKNQSDYVFEYLLTTSCTNRVIQEWVLRAGINKKITFHCGRHTFATMMLDLGTDIYTVSKLLGHKDISTTQIYAKIMDKNKQKAVANIPDIF